MFKHGGNGIDVKLHNMHNTPDIVWVKGNSYVKVAVPEKATDYVKTFLTHTDNNGEQFLIYSVNGIGEIRWEVNNSYDLRRDENRIVADYFRNGGIL